MSNWKTDIRYAVKEIAKGGSSLNSMIIAIVDSVDEAARTCTVTTISGDEELLIDGVLLQTSVDDGFVIYPKIGSTVFISNSDKMPTFVAMYSEVDKVVAVQTKWTFNKGDLGGLVKVIPTAEKIKALEEKVNGLISKFNAHTHILTLTVGTGTAAPPANQDTPISPLTQQSDIEDTKVLH